MTDSETELCVIRGLLMRVGIYDYATVADGVRTLIARLEALR